MEFKFTQANQERIEQETKKYPVRKPAVMAALIYCTGAERLYHLRSDERNC